MIVTSSTQNLLNFYQKNLAKLNNLIHLNYLLQPFTLKPFNLILSPKFIQKKIFEDMLNDVKKFPIFITNLQVEQQKILLYIKEQYSNNALIDDLFDIIELSKQYEQNQTKIFANIIRFDFLFDQNTNQFQEVEFNIIAAGGGFTSTGLNSMLRQINFENQIFPNKLNVDNYKKSISDFFLNLKKYYPNKNGSFAIVYDEKESLMFETIRKTLFQIGIKFVNINISDFKTENFSIKNGFLYFKEIELSVIYFRYFYDSSHFTDDSKNVQAMAYSSKVIMIPDPCSLLMSLKNIQHLFYNEKMLKQYDLQKMKELVPEYFKHQTPTYQYKNDFDENLEKMLNFIEINGGENTFILKTLQEGGYGDVLSGSKLLNFLNENEDKLNQMLLVKKIDPPKIESILLNQGKLEILKNTVQEFGFYQTIIYEKNENSIKILFQNEGDVLIRTKEAQNTKGSMAQGTSFIDSIGIIN